MSFSDAYFQKMAFKGRTARERNYRRAQREFNQYFENALTRAECSINGIPTQAVFQDQSQSNNKDLSDDKYMVVPNDVKVGVGSYVHWSDADWLVFTEENKTIPTHQQLKLKHVNRRLKWLVDKGKKKICNDGEGWGAYVQNQTLYTLGVSFSGSHLPLANAKMSVFIQDNPETRNVKIGTRLFIAGQVYKVEFSDYVSRIGLVNWLLGEDTRNEDTDNFELGVADYYEVSKASEEHKDKSSEEHTPKTPETTPGDDSPKVEWNIEGEHRMRLGRSYVVSVKNSDDTQPEVTEWIVDTSEATPFYVLEHDAHTLTVRVKDNFKLVGTQTSIAAKVNGEVKNLAVKIIKKFG